MNHDEHDELWKLLGKAREPKVSPYFARKVCRAIREERAEPVTFWAWMRRKWFLPVTAGACAAAAIVALNPTVPPDTKPTGHSVNPYAGLTHVIIENDEPDVSISALLATKDNSVWLSADPSSFYP